MSALRPSPPEQFSCYSHLAGAVAAVAGTTALVALTRRPMGVAVSLVYGLSMVFLFSASAAYHALKDTPRGQTFWRRLDHLAIFFMIAGSYTPFCWYHLHGAWRWSVLGVQWGLVLLGAIFKLVYLHAPRWVTAAVYVVMGWVAVVPMHRLLPHWDAANIALLVGGGVVYTAGAVIYALKRPDPLPGRFGFHEIFHVAVLLAAALHYAAIFRILV